MEIEGLLSCRRPVIDEYVVFNGVAQESIHLVIWHEIIDFDIFIWTSPA